MPTELQKLDPRYTVHLRGVDDFGAMGEPSFPLLSFCAEIEGKLALKALRRSFGRAHAVGSAEVRKHMKKATQLMLLLAVALTAWAQDTQQGGSFITTAVPTQFTQYIGQVQRVTFRMVPGYCGKIYIGVASMNVSTLVGVIKVMYPNCYGGLSDEYTIQDVTGGDGINAGQFYIAAENPGDVVMWEVYASASTPTQFLQLVQIPGPSTLVSGPLVGDAGDPTDSGRSVLQVNVVPGMSGKIDIAIVTGSPAVSYVLKNLYPNNGVVTGNITDKWELYAVNPNSITAPFFVQPEVEGEFALVAMWTYVPAG